MKTKNSCPCKACGLEERHATREKFNATSCKSVCLAFNLWRIKYEREKAVIYEAKKNEFINDCYIEDKIAKRRRKTKK